MINRLRLFLKCVCPVVLLSVFLFVLPSCEKQDNADFTEPVVPELADFFSDVYVTNERLEAEFSFWGKYIWNGTVIQEDAGMSADSVAELLQAQIEKNDFCPAPGGEILLHFEDEIPSAIKVYNHYYMDEYNRFIYSDFQTCDLIEPADTAETALEIGLDFASVLSSTVYGPAHYRILRLVCTFESQMTEYYIFIR